MKKIVGLVLCLGFCLGLMTTAQAANGPAALWVADVSSTPTHWNIETSATITAEVRGVEITPLQPTIPVWVKSSDFGNQELLAYRIGATNNYSFTYKPPDNACNTTVVAYGTIGHNASNDLIDDDLLNNSSSAAAGFRFLYLGAPLDCHPLPIKPITWGALKARYN